MRLRAMNDPCRGSREEPGDDWPDRSADDLVEPATGCPCCGASEGDPCDAATHADYERALCASMVSA